MTHSSFQSKTARKNESKKEETDRQASEITEVERDMPR